MRYELSDAEWITNKLMLPDKPRGVWRIMDALAAIRLQRRT